MLVSSRWRVAAEFGVIMLLYLRQAWDASVANGKATDDDLLNAIHHGAVLRVRPKAMTVAVIVAGLVPIMVGAGTGSEVMQRIAAPMVGGMVTAPLLSMFVIPAAYLILRRRARQNNAARIALATAATPATTAECVRAACATVVTSAHSARRRCCVPCGMAPSPDQHQVRQVLLRREVLP